MFFNPTSLPYSIFHIMVDSYVPITDSFSYRPDKIVNSAFGESDLRIEIMCNLVNNLSPLSSKSGINYLTPSQLFQSYISGV